MATTPTVWNRSVPLIEDGDPVKASVPNAPIQVLTDRTAALKAILDSIKAGEQLVLRDAPVNPDVAEGSVVYLDLSTLRHEAALAKWEDLESAGGRLFPADSAVYTGVIASKPHAGAANILLGGYTCLEETAILALFGTTTPAVGTYYLSSLTAGTVEATTPAMSVRVLQYVGGNIIRVFPPQTEPVTHTHRHYTVHADNWLDVTFFDAGIVPEGASYGYNFNSPEAVAQNLGEALLPSVGEASFIYLGESTPLTGSSSGLPTFQCPQAGLHVTGNLIRLDENGIWWFDEMPPDCDLDMTVTSADTKGEALIHVIQNLTPDSLDITTTNGRTKIGDKPFAPSTLETPGHVVVKGITDRSLLMGPVVEEIRGGAGIIATSNNPSDTGHQGIVSIRDVGADGVFLEASLLNLNNAVTDTDAPFVFTLFPSGRVSSATAKRTLPNFGTVQYQMVLWAQFLAPEPSQVAPVVTDYLIAPAPDAAGVTPVPQVASFPAFPASISPGDLYLVESSPIDATVFSKGTVFFTLQSDNPSAGLKMVNLGVRLIVLDN
jgi:hypothetical protein